MHDRVPPFVVWAGGTKSKPSSISLWFSYLPILTGDREERVQVIGTSLGPIPYYVRHKKDSANEAADCRNTHAAPQNLPIPSGATIAPPCKGCTHILRALA